MGLGNTRISTDYAQKSSHTLHITFLRTSVDHGEGVLRSRNLGEWSNMIGYEMGFTIGRGLHQEEEEEEEAINMVTLLTRGVLQRSSFLGNLKPLDKKLVL